MSVNLVFGRNLRSLAEERGSLSRAAEGLGISRVQFQRYLRGESFPKPNLLERICKYFGVDARVLTEPLTDSLRAEMRRAASPQPPRPTESPLPPAFTEVFPAQRYIAGPHRLEDGLYSAWRRSFSQIDRYCRIPLQVQTEGGLKVVRGYDSITLYPKGTDPALRMFRGVCLRLPDNTYVFLFLHAEPNVVASMAYLAPPVSMNRVDVWHGFAALGRAEMQGTSRAARMVLCRESSSLANLTGLAHSSRFLREEELPEHIRLALLVPGI